MTEEPNSNSNIPTYSASMVEDHSCVDCGCSPCFCQERVDEEEALSNYKKRVHSVKLGEVSPETVDRLLADPNHKLTTSEPPPTPATMMVEDNDDDATKEQPAPDDANTKPRRWLVDRCDGNEQQMNPHSRPCCAIFYAPLLLKFFPDILEQNPAMECLGKTGLISPRNNMMRKLIMTTALLSTIVGWGFLVYADFAISNQYPLIEAAAFNYASISFRANNNNVTASMLNATRISLGLRAAAVSSFSLEADEDYFDREEATRVIAFDDFCAAQEKEEETTQQSVWQTLASRIVFVDPDQCDQCAQASRAMVSSILMSTITYFFTFTTDVLRIWPNYDVNCQKVFGAFFAVFSTVMGLRTWFLYRNQCYASFANGWTCYNANLEVVECGPNTYDYDTSSFYFESPEVAFHVYTHWQIGGGLVALGVATFAKLLDLLCNFVVPTPSITRNRDEQWEYERFVKEGGGNDEEEKADDNDDEQSKLSQYSWLWESTREWR